MMEHPNFRPTLELMSHLPYLLREKDMCDFLGVNKVTVRRWFPDIRFPITKPDAARMICKFRKGA